MTDALNSLRTAREAVDKERMYNGVSSHSNVAVYMQAYSSAEAYISELEKRLDAYEHEHEWTEFGPEGSFVDMFRSCECGAMQSYWPSTNKWLDLVVHNA